MSTYLAIKTLLQARRFWVYKEVVKPEMQTLIQDIALAMFRVASVAKHEGVESSLKNLAVKIISEESSEYIHRAENLIVLGQGTGDIKEVNAAVLLRELSVLKKQLETAGEEEADVDISSMFDSSVSASVLSRSSVIPATRLADLSCAKPAVSLSNPSKEASPRWKAGIYTPSHRGEPVSLDNISRADTKSKSAKYAESTPPKPKRGLVQLSAEAADSLPKHVLNGAKKHGSINPDKIFEYIKEHKVARLKELEAAFREVSGRTIRRITDSLLKSGQIERVGNPGPTSFYRLKIAIPKLSESSSLATPASTSIITL